MKCPCCGHETEATLEVLRSLPLSRMKRLLLDVLLDAYPRPVSLRKLVDMAYADDATGGPESSRNTMAVHLHQLRKKLDGTGWTAGSVANGTIGIYRVEETVRSAA